MLADGNSTTVHSGPPRKDRLPFSLSLSLSLYDVPFDVQSLSVQHTRSAPLPRTKSCLSRHSPRRAPVRDCSTFVARDRFPRRFVARAQSVVLGHPRPRSTHTRAILRSRDPAAAPLLARSLHLRPATGLSAAREYPVPRGKGGEVTRSSDRSSGCAPGNHHLTHLPSPLSFRTRVRVIRLQLLPRRILIQRTPSVHPASTTADPCTAACPV